MKVSFAEVLARGEPVAMVVHSLDQALYQVTVRFGSEERLLTENNGKTFRRHALSEVREALQMLPVSRLTLRHQSAYDEMIGQSVREGANTLEVGLSMDLYPPVSKH